MLLDSEGHLRLTDFGLAKANLGDGGGEGGGRTNSFIGTMEYMAPEIISAQVQLQTSSCWCVRLVVCGNHLLLVLHVRDIAFSQVLAA